MKTILITGGTGLIGMELAKKLKAKGNRLVLLTRTSRPVAPYDAVFSWDPEKGEIDGNALKDVDILIHLAGAGIADERWTPERKQVIISSRVNSLQVIRTSLKDQNLRLEALISGSAIGWYGAISDDKIHFENEPAAADFMGETCRLWEEAADSFQAFADRIVKIRTGVVLSLDGGALAKLITPVKLFVGSPLGSGRQQMPWIHIHDIVNTFDWATSHAEIKGAFNATAGGSCTNRQFTKALAEATHRPMLPFSVPSFVLRAMFGEMSATFLEGSRISNQKLLDHGFTFEFPELGPALKDLIQQD